MLSHFRHVIRELHPQQVIHIRTERLFDSKRHLGCESCLAMEEIGECRAAHFEYLCGLRHIKTESFDDLCSD
jgi:hypothetical protein